MTTIQRTRARALVALLASGALVAAAAIGAAPAGADSSGSRARFIITVADGVDSRTVAADHRRTGAQVDFVYTAALNGFAGAMSQADLGELQRDRRVTRIERDGIATASETTTQNGATWGLDRIDQRALPLSTSYIYTSTGAGVSAYIIDTGIRLSHTEFGGRAISGHDAVDGGSADDCNGHGTHVAGTVGGTTYGVAKSVSLVAVRVLGCDGSGPWSGVIAGMDWVTANHAAGAPAVANLSIGGGASSSVDDAVRGMHNDGVTVVVAAGNGNWLGIEQDACKYSPARAAEAVTVGATTQTDAKTSWSNYGSCVDLFSPGAGITSAWYTSNTATNTISGTSMAAPHVAGVAALFLQRNTAASPTTVRNAVYDAATKGIVTSSKTTNNHLLYSPLTTEPVANVAPTAAFTYTCTGLTCSFNGSTSSDDTGITSYAWTFGDSTTGSGVTTSRTYNSGGTYPVQLTVTDNAGATGTSSQSVVVTAPATGGITLSANGYKVKGVQQADLTWSGATSTSVDVFRNGTQRTTTGNDGVHTDTIGSKGGGSYTYKVCNAGTGTCSNDVTVTF